MCIWKTLRKRAQLNSCQDGQNYRTRARNILHARRDICQHMRLEAEHDGIECLAGELGAESHTLRHSFLARIEYSEARRLKSRSQPAF